MLCMDRKQQNVQVCRTGTGGITIHGCSACESMGVEMIDIRCVQSRFKLCSPESYHLSSKKYKSKSEHSKACGYNTYNYDAMKINGIHNFHSNCPVDLHHCMHNCMEMIQQAITMNVLNTKDYVAKYNQYLACLTKERDPHNCLEYPSDLDSKSRFYPSIKLDAAFNVSV